MKRICSRCKTEKEIEEFHWKDKLKGTRQHTCRPCHSDYLKEHYAKKPEIYAVSNKKSKGKLRDFIRAAKDKPCADCGITYPYYVMDFDHLRDKNFELSQGVRTGSLDKVGKEIDKCDVVCANCHRERTFNKKAI